MILEVCFTHKHYDAEVIKRMGAIPSVGDFVNTNNPYVSGVVDKVTWLLQDEAPYDVVIELNY